MSLPVQERAAALSVAHGLQQRHTNPRFVPLSHETYGRAGPPAFALLHELAEVAASTGAVSKNIFMENAMRDRLLSQPACSASPPVLLLDLAAGCVG